MSRLWSIYRANLISLSSFPNHLAEPHLIPLPKRRMYTHTHINAFWDLQREMDDLNDELEENELEDLASLFSCQALVFSCFSL
jgi:hypothetical protein